MKDGLFYKLRSGKPVKLFYFVKNGLRMLVPDGWFRMRLSGEIKGVQQRADKDYIEGRVNYYNKLSGTQTLPEGEWVRDEFRYMNYLGKLKNYTIKIFHKAYYFDLREYSRWFSPDLKIAYCPGDVYFTPDIPSLVKSRLLAEDNANSVVMKLDKFRHFMFVNDNKDFTEKKDMVIFRGKVRKSRLREKFLRMYFHHPLCDCGVVGKDDGVLEEWITPKKTIREHLDYKFIMALEGNDVASNLKWVMSSNSLAVMPRPTCETWFMEGTLIPDYHYVEIKEDLSDLEEKMNYYIAHPDKARQIIRHAHEYVDQFRDEKRERLISLLVLRKYFRRTGQV